MGCDGVDRMVRGILVNWLVLGWVLGWVLGTGCFKEWRKGGRKERREEEKEGRKEERKEGRREEGRVAWVCGPARPGGRFGIYVYDAGRIALLGIFRGE